MSKAHTRRFLPVIALACFLFLILLSFYNSAAAAPLLDDPTPTPTIINYWTANTQSYTWTNGDGNSACLASGGWLADIDEQADCPDLYAPEENAPAGILVKLNSVTYNGDVRLVEQTNTDWVKKFNDVWDTPPIEMTAGQTICVGTSGACAAAGYEVDTDSDWEGYTTGDTYKYVPDIHTYAQLGNSGSVNFTITPIYYGLVMDPDGLFCNPLDLDNTDEIETGTLLGTDEVGRVIEDLIVGEQYLLFTTDGPWDDGTDSRYDIAIRFFDGESWGEFIALNEFVDESADPKDICDDSFLDSEDNEALSWTATEETAKFQIRVNDEEGQFTDNEDSINYVFSTAAPGFGQGCDNYWAMNNKILSLTIDATNSNWQTFLPVSEFISQGVYALVVDGTYLDNGVTANDIAVSNFSDLAGEWQRDYVDYNLWTGVDCDLETDEYKEYYGNSRITFYDFAYTYGMPITPYGRVEDNQTPLNFSNNSGTIYAEIYEAEYNAPRSDCATTYDKGTYLETISVPALSSNGISWPISLPKLEDNQVYYLEPVTPYMLGGDTRSYDFEIKPNALALGSWQPDYYYADCVTAVDHERNGYYFQTDYDLLPSLNEYDNGDFMWLRADSSGGVYDDNIGTLQVELYGASSNVVPDDDECSDYYTANTLVYTDTYAADSSTGYSIDHSVFEPGQIYKLAVNDSFDIRRSYSGSGAIEYQDPILWDGALCTELDGGQHIVWFEADALSDYEIRNHNYGSESGTDTFEVYTSVTIKNPAQGCEYRDYHNIDEWYWIIADEQVAANNSGEGEDLGAAYLLANSLSGDSNYKIITSGGPWTSSGAPYAGYDLDISTNGGATWQALNDWLDCVVTVDSHIRGYKSNVTEDGPFMLRVRDPEELWINNQGSITINFYTDTIDDEANDTRYDPSILPDGYSYGCTAKCVKPGPLEVGAWVEFARCRIVAFLAWCPWHTARVNELRNKFTGIEPFSTIMELVDLGRAVQAEVDTYTWVDEGGGEDVAPEVQPPANYIFAPGEGGGADVPIVGEDSIWGSGEITLLGPTGQSYSTECDNLLADSLGTRLAAPVCFAFNVTDRLGLNTWFQLLWDLGMLFALFWYIKKNWVDSMQ